MTSLNLAIKSTWVYWKKKMTLNTCPKKFRTLKKLLQLKTKAKMQKTKYRDKVFKTKNKISISKAFDLNNTMAPTITKIGITIIKKALSIQLSEMHIFLIHKQVNTKEK